jgi:CDP-diacylglycerol--glycerol-3-phosphate 3-phosphatidyltransferase
MKTKKSRPQHCWIPWSLTLLRVVLAPLLVFMVWAGAFPGLIAVILLAAFLSDIFDGILARKWGVETPSLRRADSLADVIFYLGVLAAAWFCGPPEFHDRLPLLAALLGLEAIQYAVGFIRFGKSPANHSYSAKFLGILLFAAAISLLVFNTCGWVVDLALYWGLGSELENIGILFLLPTWSTNIPTLWHAYKMR